MTNQKNDDSKYFRLANLYARVLYDVPKDVDVVINRSSVSSTNSKTEHNFTAQWFLNEKQHTAKFDISEPRCESKKVAIFKHEDV